MMLLSRLHPAYLALVQEEAKLLMANNWASWEREQPEWFSPRWVRALPTCVLPQQRLAQFGGKLRVRSSLAEQIGGALLPP